MVFFFFKQKTAYEIYQCDWSSDVCSSDLPLLGDLYDRYSFSVLPRLGKLVARDADSYRYLAESIRRFPAQEKLAAMMESAGLGQVRFRNLCGGIAAIHSAWRL